MEKHKEMFLPFFLAVRPRACDRIRFEAYIRVFNGRPGIQFNDEIQSIIEEQAEEAGVLEEENVQMLRNTLFVRGSCQSSTSEKPANLWPRDSAKP